MFEFLLYHRFDDFGTLTRTRFIEVPCERCRHLYGYLLTRSRRVFGDRYVWQRRESARLKAMAEAERELEAKLNRGIEAVPCPCCGWYQSAMLGRARRECYPKGTWSAFLAFLLAIVAAGCLVGLDFLEKNFGLNWKAGWVALSMTFVLMICCGLLCIVRQELRARKYDPNATPVEERIARGQQRALTPEQFRSLSPGRSSECAGKE